MNYKGGIKMIKHDVREYLKEALIIELCLRRSNITEDKITHVLSQYIKIKILNEE